MKAFFSLLLLLAGYIAAAQVAADSVPQPSQPVEILPGTKKQMFRKLEDGTELQILVGNVGLRQGNSLFYCDSLVLNTTTKILEAFGRVHINDSDTTHIYANYLKYLTDVRMAYLKGNVRLTGGQGTLRTDELEYDVATKIGTYKNGGRVVSRKSVLTSREGVYYGDTKDIFFRNKVTLKDPAYTLATDSMIYNTESQMARFVTDTDIRDSSGRTIRTKEGSYNMQSGMAEFTKRTTIRDGDVTVSGDQIINDDKSGISQVRGNGVLVDRKNGVSILANEIFADKKKEAYLATRKPLMIIRQDNDSIYVAADTLFTGRISDRFPVRDTVVKKATAKGKAAALKKDSTDRYFEGFRNVRVFADSLQAVSDSLYYSFKDSTFRLYQDPIVWSKKSQVTGDTIYLFTKNKKADHFKVFENSFLVSEQAPGLYNQVRSTRMDGFFKEGAMDSVRAKGSAESIYYLQDSDSAYTGVNQTVSDALDVYFSKGDLNKVVFRSAVKGTLWPISQKTPAEMQLKDFRWLDSRRPKTKYALYE